ncbi:uncharacterized protein [Coffea arabica]|uniref:Uncharacterized protein isoform X2 n=1 Tax=Coffea arabica TaxID=13443 RepID=A0ABM4V6J1_COFAR
MSEIGQTAPSLILKASPEAVILMDALLRSSLAGCILGHDLSGGGDRKNIQEVNDSMFIDDGEAIDLPDGLVQFRMNFGGTLR